MSRDRIVKLLYKKELNLLDADERAELERWIAGSGRPAPPQAGADAGEAESLYRRYNGIDGTDARIAMLERIRAHRRRRVFSRRLAIFASAAACIAVIILLIPDRGVEIQEEADHNIAFFDSEYPTLRLGDGRQISLKDALLEQENGQVKVYTADGEKHTFVQDKKEPENNPTLTIISPKGSVYDFTMADGTHVWMNADSRITYPMRFTGGKREVELEGEAYFEVARDEKNPFRVISGGQTVEVLGTEFNVNAHSGREVIYTTLVSGSVSVTYGDHGEKVLYPGTQSIVMEDGIYTRPVRASEIIGWRNGMFVLEGKRLDEIMYELCLWYDMEVTFGSESLKHIYFKGLIPQHPDIRAVLNVFKLTKEINFEIEGDRILITR